MLPILQIGPFALQTPGLILLIGAWAGLSLAERYAKRFQINPNQLYNLAFIGLIAGILGALLAIPIAGIIQVILRDIWAHRDGRPLGLPMRGDDSPDNPHRTDDAE